MSKSKTDIAIETVKKKSRSTDGSGTIMIAKIAMTKRTTMRSFDLKIESKNGLTR